MLLQSQADLLLLMPTPQLPICRCPCVYAANADSNKRWCCGDMPHLDVSQWALRKITSETTRWGYVVCAPALTVCAVCMAGLISAFGRHLPDLSVAAPAACLQSGTEPLAATRQSTMRRRSQPASWWYAFMPPHRVMHVRVVDVPQDCGHQLLICPCCLSCYRTTMLETSRQASTAPHRCVRVV